MQIHPISESEHKIMKVIWERNGTALYSEITESLKESDHIWRKNTVLTFLSRLTEKGFLSIRKIGHRNEYSALVSAEEYKTYKTQTFIGEVYEGNAKGLIATLLEKDLVSCETLEELQAYWSKKAHDE